MATYTKYDYRMPTGTLKDYMPEYNTYNYTKPSETFNAFQTPYGYDIRKAQLKLDELDKNKPGAYSSAYTDRINELIDKMGSRKFSYDVNADALYNQYKDSYMRQGKQAMQDTVGQAAAMTGGYGNSYAATAGSQAYQSYLDQLNDRIPELYQLAMDRYNMEGSDMQNMYSILANQDANDYAKYRDTVADYQNDRSYYDTRYQNLYAQAQNLWGQNWSNYLNVSQMNDNNRQNAVNTALSMLQNDWDNYHWAESQTAANYAQAVAEDQWNAQFAENQRQFNESQAQSAAQAAAQLAENQRQFNESQKTASSGYSQNYSNVRNKIVSQADFNKSRRLSNNYQSYAAYVTDIINKAGNLSDAEIAQLILDYNL